MEGVLRLPPPVKLRAGCLLPPLRQVDDRGGVQSRKRASDLMAENTEAIHVCKREGGAGWLVRYERSFGETSLLFLVLTASLLLE
jgi:hypothetical protein